MDDSDVLKLSIDELIDHWRSRKISQRFFCNKYNLNETNFRKFLKGDRSSNSIIATIQKFLIGSEVKAPEKECNQIYHELIAIIKTRNIKRILFIDGDNVFIKMSWLSKVDIPPDLQIVLCLSHNYKSAVFSDFVSPQITIFHSLTNMKDAVDQALGILMAMLNISIDNKIVFIIATNDRMAYEISLQIHLYGRRCLVIQSNYDAEALFSTRPLPQIPLETDILSYDDIKLRESFNIYWSGSIGEFCDSYDLDQGHFCSWLHKNYKNKASVIAVRCLEHISLKKNIPYEVCLTYL